MWKSFILMITILCSYYVLFSLIISLLYRTVLCRMSVPIILSQDGDNAEVNNVSSMIQTICNVLYFYIICYPSTCTISSILIWLWKWLIWTKKNGTEIRVQWHLVWFHRLCHVLFWDPLWQKLSNNCAGFFDFFHEYWIMLTLMIFNCLDVFFIFRFRFQYDE